ncbi:hypothetical protein CAPTEDRAFT_194382 [Capitella teleta]|uniref:Uncharacterized protein n=1 Tax=Capitella teleta TaxID=283909 RepID=R7UYP6_CAPTE|nr:hypothetical protein CAPTEDRAFT_194382 [Capitella teleta]|eukprot:ELU11412.1 hypothetical protein CAPTEDRAFT_194382 [Capitella teleta]
MPPKKKRRFQPTPPTKPGVARLYLTENYATPPTPDQKILNGHALYLFVTNERSPTLTAKAFHHLGFLTDIPMLCIKQCIDRLVRFSINKNTSYADCREFLKLKLVDACALEFDYSVQQRPRVESALVTESPTAALSPVPLSPLKTRPDRSIRMEELDADLQTNFLLEAGQIYHALNPPMARYIMNLGLKQGCCASYDESRPKERQVGFSLFHYDPNGVHDETVSISDAAESTSIKSSHQETSKKKKKKKKKNKQVNSAEILLSEVRDKPCGLASSLSKKIPPNVANSANASSQAKNRKARKTNFFNSLQKRYEDQSEDPSSTGGGSGLKSFLMSV